MEIAVEINYATSLLIIYYKLFICRKELFSQTQGAQRKNTVLGKECQLRLDKIY